MTSLKPLVQPAGGGKKVNVLVNVIRIVVHSRDTGGTFSVVETNDGAQEGPPPHIHHREDETLHVLEGEYEFNVGGKTHRVGKGATVVGPRDVAHAYKCVSAGGGRMLVFFSPGGFERFFEEVDALGPPEKQEIPRVMELGLKYGLEFLPPPA
ncbi:MAG TPA: cupin domain-containing protein [Verrucomicrobiae bacterium]|jgi:quercetin dioxygenase-like cupin family protein